MRPARARLVDLLGVFGGRGTAMQRVLGYRKGGAALRYSGRYGSLGSCALLCNWRDMRRQCRCGTALLSVTAPVQKPDVRLLSPAVNELLLGFVDVVLAGARPHEVYAKRMSAVCDATGMSRNTIRRSVT